MNRMIRKPLFYFVLLISFTTGGCYSELSELELGSIKWSPELGVPLVDSRFTLSEILETNAANIDYTTNSENTIVFTLADDSLFSQSATEYYSVPDRDINVPPIILTPNEINEFNQNGSVSISRSVNVNNPLAGDYDRLLIDEGTVSADVTEDFPANVDMAFSLDAPTNIRLFDYQHVFGYNIGGNPVGTDQQSDQFGSVEFIFDQDASQSQLAFNFDITISRVDQDLTFGENSILLNLQVRDIIFNAIYGDLSTQNIVTDLNTISTDFFSGVDFAENIDYFFEDPKFSLILTNSMGLPVRFQIDNFLSFKNGAQTVEPIDNTIELLSAPEGEIVQSETNFDQAFKDLVNNVPDSVSLQISGLIDPENVADNFVTKDSYIQAGYEIELPLELSLSGLEINETVELDGVDLQDLDYALFKFTSENSLPIDLNFRADLLREDSSFVRTLFDGKFLGGGSPSQPETLSDLIRLEDNLEGLADVRRIGIKATISTTNNGTTIERITADAAVQFNLAVQAKYNVNL
ncbi:hypothetical protein QYS48_30645 [Marivirga arenosa]|uniref:DUF4270 family protein n=1 Tax=Marivirga arenosa TaxID=3059076 RepID=A0AA51R7U8_9BACT|nr:hypothetical protein [Marivirga sp. ABR2-2]WMN07987.1 hypothetical protein QYS48_30645 [Marivirga sp. ABR2-2]